MFLQISTVYNYVFSLHFCWRHVHAKCILSSFELLPHKETNFSGKVTRPSHDSTPYYGDKLKVCGFYVELREVALHEEKSFEYDLFSV